MNITRKQKWEEKQLYGHKIRKPLERNWIFLIAAQNNAIKTNHIRARTDKTQQNSKCRLCGDSQNDQSHNKQMLQTWPKRV